MGRVRYRPRQLIVLVAAIAVLTGCSAVPDYDPPAPDATITASVPPGGMSLRELGGDQGPVDAVTIPRSHQLRVATFQVNVVNLVFVAPDAGELAEWFRTTLPEAGWTITTDSNDALIFTGHGWDGVFTPMGDGSSGGTFSLRQQGR